MIIPPVMVPPTVNSNSLPRYNSSNGIKFLHETNVFILFTVSKTSLEKVKQKKKRFRKYQRIRISSLYYRKIHPAHKNMQFFQRFLPELVNSTVNCRICFSVVTNQLIDHDLSLTISLNLG